MLYMLSNKGSPLYPLSPPHIWIKLRLGMVAYVPTYSKWKRRDHCSGSRTPESTVLFNMLEGDETHNYEHAGVSQLGQGDHEEG
jgi:hypothetical protein